MVCAERRAEVDAAHYVAVVFGYLLVAQRLVVVLVGTQARHHSYAEEINAQYNCEYSHCRLSSGLEEIFHYACKGNPFLRHRQTFSPFLSRRSLLFFYLLQEKSLKVWWIENKNVSLHRNLPKPPVPN